MKGEAKIYTRLTRNAAGVASSSSLWLAQDHLLIVRSNRVSEEYSRVQFRDIKAFMVMESDRRSWWTFIWGVLATVFLCVAVYQLLQSAHPTVPAICFGVLLGILGWNHWLGRGCATYVITDVQTARLAPLMRIKKTHRVLAQLEPLIRAAQAEFATPPPIVPSVPPPLA